MFGSLKKKLKKSIEKLSKKVEEPLEKPEERIEKVTEKPDEKIEKIKEPEKLEEPKEEKKQKLKLRQRITTKEFSDNDIDNFFGETETELLEANVALEVAETLKENLKKNLVGKHIKRGQSEETISHAFEDSLFQIVDQGSIDLGSRIKGQLKIIFLGFNGSGKTTTIAKIAHYLQKKGHKPVISAGDTFRAASIEQLEHHGNKLGVKVIKHKYGSDSAAVFFDAVKYAESNGCDVVLGDTAGRTHANKNLMNELEKIVRVNKPDLKILVIDSLTGNDAIDQAQEFDKLVGVDAVVMTKTDVNQKGGSILSVCHAIKKSILFLGTGQGYDDIKRFDPKEFVRELLS